MTIRPIEKGDVPKAVRTMADSFQDEALYVYFIPDAQRRARFLERFMRFRLKFGMKYGTVLVTDDCAGVAVFLPPGNRMKPADLLLLGGMAALLRCSAPERKRIMAFNDYADRVCADCIRTPHWHLSPICVAPQSQGKGYGGALLAQGLETVAAGAPCFLETQSEKNEGFYARYGFVTRAAAPIPGSAIPHIAMVKQ